MALRIHNTKHLSWEDNNTTSVNYYELIADTLTDVPTDPYYFSTDTDRYKIAQGSIAYIIFDSAMYMYDSTGTWIKQEGGSGGGGFIPSDEQLAAMNSGITAEDVQAIGEKLAGLSSGTTAGQLVSFGSDGYTVANSGVSVETSSAGMTANSDSVIPTSKNIADNVASTATISSNYSDATGGAIAQGDTIEGAIGKLENRTESVENNILSEQQKTTGMGTGGSNYIQVNGIKMYFDTNAPTGASVGDLWVGG